MHISAVYYVDISWRSAARGRQTREVWEKQAIFKLNASQYLENSKRCVQSYY